MNLLRYTSITEAVSYMLLLIVAMPLKYFFGIPQAVQITGMLHGILFLLLCYFVITRWYGGIISLKWAFIVMVCSLIPLVPFFIDGHLKRLGSQQISEG